MQVAAHAMETSVNCLRIFSSNGGSQCETRSAFAEIRSQRHAAKTLIPSAPERALSARRMSVLNRQCLIPERCWHCRRSWCWRGWRSGVLNQLHYVRRIQSPDLRRNSARQCRITARGRRNGGWLRVLRIPRILQRRYVLRCQIRRRKPAVLLQ